MNRANQYEVWLADLNPRQGTEPGKRRPVLIVQTDLLKQHSSTIICPLTTNVIEGVSILRVNLKSGEAGLTRDSAIMLDQIRAIDNRRLVKKLGQLPVVYVDAVVEQLKICLDMG